MIRLNAYVQLKIDTILSDVRFANIASLRQVGALLMRIARAMIIISKRPSTPGSAPHSRHGQLRRAIRFESDAKSVVIGPTWEGVGTSLAAHEFGGRYRGEQYPERRLMGPALERVIDKLPSQWEASIRG